MATSELSTILYLVGTEPHCDRPGVNYSLRTAMYKLVPFAYKQVSRAHNLSSDPPFYEQY